MKIYSYVVRFDGGFAPNPFGKCCTLATCKPRIRKKAQRGDWVIGTGSVKNVGNYKLIYAMMVEERLTIEEYSKDERFQHKIPKWNSNDPVKRVGDNIYYKNERNEFIQRPSIHSNNDGTENRSLKDHDMSGEYVLISNYYCYYGENAIQIPSDFQIFIKKGPGHKSNFADLSIKSFIAWLNTSDKIKGLQGNPFLIRKELNFGNECLKHDGLPGDDED